MARDNFNQTIYNQKVDEYKKYIDMHIANVKKVYAIYGKQVCERLGVDYERLGDMIHDHDESKYSVEEFEGFRCYYYPTPEEEADKEMAGFRKKKYDAAWLHHLRNNAHHPEFWIYINEDGNPRCHPMDPLHVAEMVIDWAAMGIYFKDTAYHYWNDNVHAKPLHPDSVKLVDSCIDIFKDPVPED